MADKKPEGLAQLESLPPEHHALLTAALASPHVPKIYCNGYILATTHSDLVLIMQQNNQPVAVVNGSYTLMKTLAEGLTKSVAEWEKIMETTIKTTHDIDTAIGKSGI